MSKTLTPETTRLIEIVGAFGLSHLEMAVFLHNLDHLDRVLVSTRAEAAVARTEIQSMREMQQRINEDREALETRHQNEVGTLRAETERLRDQLQRQARNGEQRISALRHRYRSGIMARDTVKRIELERRRLAKENKSLKAQVAVLSSKQVDVTELRDDLERVYERLSDLLGHSDDGDEWNEYRE